MTRLSNIAVVAQTILSAGAEQFALPSGVHRKDLLIQFLEGAADYIRLAHLKARS